MASVSIRFLALAILVSVTLLQGVFADCQGSIPDLVKNCQQFIQIPGPEVTPSPECCNVVKTADIPCLCKYITKEIELIISMEKVVFVGRSCGVTLPAGTKCGSYTIPPKA